MQAKIIFFQLFKIYFKFIRFNLCQIIQLLFRWNYHSRLITNLKRYSTGNIASGGQMSQRHLAPKINFSIKLEGQVVLMRNKVVGGWESKKVDTRISTTK